MINLLIRVMILYFFMILSMKLMGKRQVGEMEMSELVTAFFLSELATFSVTDSSTPLLFGLIPILLLICVEVIISFLAVKNPIMKRFFDFSPSLLIDDGKVLEKELLNSRITIDELLSMLRLNDYYDIKKVRFAVLEPNGQLSVVPFPEEEAVVCRDFGFSGSNVGFSVAVIDDGILNKKALNVIGKTEKWVRTILRKENIKDIKDVFLLSANFDGSTKIVPKSRG